VRLKCPSGIYISKGVKYHARTSQDLAELQTAEMIKNSQRNRCTACPAYRYRKTHAYDLIPKSFMKFMFSPVYRVTQKDFYALLFTSMWAPVVARQII